MMHFCGGGVGHASTWEAMDFFKQDRNSHDAKRLVKEDDEDYDQTQQEPIVLIQSRADCDDEEEDYSYNCGQFSDTDEEEEEVDEDDECSDDRFGLEDDGGEVNEVMDDLGYGKM